MRSKSNQSQPIPDTLPKHMVAVTSQTGGAVKHITRIDYLINPERIAPERRTLCGLRSDTVYPHLRQLDEIDCQTCGTELDKLIVAGP